ncbi:PHP domain-containing protein [Acetobacterium paludosum]|uniref:PHP domain-containing protein n=1 Tax=Acetobacterium paludosum TaxID=52693 RepID=A0A923KRZ1_9FIRM|nr:PHP domain-containing protein [Acetobacterium paludosum]MBC3887797.1 PHP domain-containing protein [Acetobacterium paludosum]
MFVDMHLHECTYSLDSKISLEDMVLEARQSGLDGICITDHDSMGLKNYAERYAKEVDFPIFVGTEYLTLQGDILAFGIDSLPVANLSAQHFIDYVTHQNGICFAAHPFRNNKRGLEEHLGKVTGLTGIEVLNGNSTIAENRKALEWCKELNLHPVGGSDAHHVVQVGRYATWLPTHAKSLKEFIALFKNHTPKPAVLKGYEIIEII